MIGRRGCERGRCGNEEVSSWREGHPGGHLRLGKGWVEMGTDKNIADAEERGIRM